jgi:type I restriction enzyme, S subunit
MTWPSVTLNDLQSEEPRAITDGPFGSNLASRHYTEIGPRVVRLQNIGDGRFVDEKAHISEEHFESLRAHEVKAGDLLVASLGGVLPRACLAPVSLGPAIVKADCIRVRLRQDVDPRWVLYAMQRPEVRRWADEHRHGVGRPRLGLRVIRQIPVPLPPVEEQRRIVEILEDHLSRLDAADAYLGASQRRLDAMERAALASSRDGELFPLAEVTAIQGGIQKQQKRAPKDNAFPFLRVANVTAQGLDLAEVHRIELFDRELDRLRLTAGDLLVVEGNGSASQIGRAAIWDGSIEDCVHQNHLIRVRPLDVLLPAYLEAVWNSPQNRAKLTNVASSSSGLHTLSASKLKQLSIPVPSIERQHELVAAVSEVREARRWLSGAIATAAARRGALQRALLAAAFSGRLTGAESDLSEAEEMIGA